MRLGDVLEKERTHHGMSQVGPLEDRQAAAAMNERLPKELHIELAEYQRLEEGDSEAEIWGAVLSQIAVFLEVPTPRLLSSSGRAADTEPGQAGRLIAEARERRGRTEEEVATAVARALEELGTPFSSESYARVEQGRSPIETWGPRLLAFAEVTELPIHSLFYPCGLPFQEIDDYP